MKKSTKATTPPPQPAPCRIDLGCGPHKKEGFAGWDSIAFPGVDVVTDLREKWPAADSSVDEIHSSHCLEHFEAIERCHFINELYRVLKPAAKATIIVPDWSSCRAYGDPTHKFPPLGSFFWYYLSREWRMANAPHTDQQHWKHGYNCHFECTWGFSMEPGVAMRNQEYQQFAMAYYKESVHDIIATLIKR